MSSIAKTLQRLFHHSTKSESARPERVSGIYMQEQRFLILPDAAEKVPTGQVVREFTRSACRQSEAATTVFVP